MGLTVFVRWCVWTLVLGVVAASQRHRLNVNYQQYDSLVVARCEARCWGVQIHRNQVIFDYTSSINS